MLGLFSITYSGPDGPHETQQCMVFNGQRVFGPNVGNLPTLCPNHNTIR